jgi:hypothetical protein
MDAAAAKKLEQIIRRHGLVEPIVVNIRGSKNVVVGGHQRLKVMDKIAGGKDYSIPVAMIDVDEIEEKAINVALNNPAIQGAYDEDKLVAILGDVVNGGESDITAATGFDRAGLELLFDKGVVDSVFGEETTAFSDQAAAERETLDEMAEILEGSKEGESNKNKNDATSAAPERDRVDGGADDDADNDGSKPSKLDPNSREALVARRTEYFTDELKSSAESEFMFVVVGDSDQQISQFLALLHLDPMGRYVKLADLADAMGIAVESGRDDGEAELAAAEAAGNDLDVSDV